jgi:hypothetical protein
LLRQDPGPVEGRAVAGLTEPVEGHRQEDPVEGVPLTLLVLDRLVEEGDRAGISPRTVEQGAVGVEVDEAGVLAVQ